MSKRSQFTNFPLPASTMSFKEVKEGMSGMNLSGPALELQSNSSVTVEAGSFKASLRSTALFIQPVPAFSTAFIPAIVRMRKSILTLRMGVYFSSITGGDAKRYTEAINENIFLLLYVSFRNHKH